VSESISFHHLHSVTIFTTKRIFGRIAQFDDAGEPEEKARDVETISLPMPDAHYYEKKLESFNFPLFGLLFFAMWDTGNSALTEHIYNAPKPDVVEFAQSR
jgi:maltose/moltooligosaccharide transporter